MNPHLSDEQFTRYLSGQEDARVLDHLASCDICRLEASRLMHIVGASRAHVERSMDRHANEWMRQRNRAADALRVHPLRPRWALASAMAILIFASTFMFRTQQARGPVNGHVIVPRQTAISDDALMSAVDAALERDVPSAMAPLQQLAFQREQAEQEVQSHN